MKTLQAYKPFMYSLAIIVLFFGMILLYFSPMLEGKTLGQHDVAQYLGMSKELNDYRDSTGNEAIWTNSMFSGMPGYLISVTYNNLIKVVHIVLKIDKEHPQMLAFLYFVCFFIALLFLKIPIWLSMLGALFYGFSSYFFIIIEAGHITKAIALAYMPVIITTVVATYRGNFILGSITFSFFLALQIMTNHMQITYYTMLIILIFIGFHIFDLYKKRELKQFIKPSALLCVGIILAVLTNFGTLYMTYDYGKDTMRGASELTHNKDDQTSGLNKSYATSYSYGISETCNLLIPNYKGGASQTKLGTDSHMYKVLQENRVPRNQIKSIVSNAPTYWGDQLSTSGPVYIGAVVIFLFIFALFIIQGPIKWWLLSATIFSILIAWGNNFMFLVEPMLDYFPGFNKFRTISMILVIAQFAIPTLAIIGLHKYITDTESRDVLFKKLRQSLYVTGGFILLLLVTAGVYDFSGSIDAQLQGAWPDWLLEALKSDRKSMLIADGWRSFGFVVAVFAALTAYHYKKLTVSKVIIVLSVLTVFDLWPVNKRYLNDDDFKSPQAIQNMFFKTTEVDKAILQDPDIHYRVMNMNNPFNDAITSYHHKSIGGYHGAKLQRYQDIIDMHLSRMNMSVYNMLNAKYFIMQDRETGEEFAQQNPEVLGNAWFVEHLSFVQNPDEEIAALTNFNPKTTAFVDVTFKDFVTDTIRTIDSTAFIQLQTYAPNHLQYSVQTQHDATAVFSEIYYKKGWNAYINNELVPHFRVNYVLRALEIPAGNHTIDFKFEPHMYTVSNRISLVSSLLLLIGFLSALGWKAKSVITERTRILQE
ncbi:MAG: YfhO family protein [Bacteroidales bacterium]|nr:YfhO family protein [Bacteroidales bacterium]NLK80654.1 YfhO family protein [Bacteroidales bacterium]